MLSRLVISTIVPELRYAEVIHVNPTATFTSGLPTIRELVGSVPTLTSRRLPLSAELSFRSPRGLDNQSCAAKQRQVCCSGTHAV